MLLKCVAIWMTADIVGGRFILLKLSVQISKMPSDRCWLEPKAEGWRKIITFIKETFSILLKQLAYVWSSGADSSVLEVVI